MRHLLASESFVELQRVTGSTVPGEFGDGHVRRITPMPGNGFDGERMNVGRCIGPISGGFRPVAIRTSHLHARTIRSHQVGLQMKVVVQSHASGIHRART